MPLRDLIYPVNLPCPQVSNVTPVERRQMSGNRPREARALQRDRATMERITWPPMTSAQSDALLTWWRDHLTFGGAWFSADWPSPRGSAAVIRKFKEQPKWQFVAGGYWRLSALCETRGLSEVPRGVFSYEVDLDGILNAGSSVSVGVTLGGLDPGEVYTVTLPRGRKYVAWTAVPNNWRSDFRYTTAGGTTTVGVFGAGFDTAEEARKAIDPFTITGYDSYTFWILDIPPTDNGGGLSLAIT